MVRCLLLVAVAGLVGGCGLIDPNVTNFDLGLPDKTFTVDTSKYFAVSGTYEGVACQPQGPDVCAAAEQACHEGQCTGSCNASSSTCDLTVVVAPWKNVDLYNEKQELHTIQDQPLIDVTIDAIHYEVSENTLNVPTPQFDVYVAPATVMSPDSDEAQPIGTIGPVEAGATVAPREFELTADGRAALAARMGDFRTPFNIIYASTMVLADGSPIPQGRLTAKISIEAHAGL